MEGSKDSTLEVRLTETQARLLEEENTSTELRKEVEVLRQGNYSLTLKLKSTEQTLQLTSAELDTVQEQLQQNSKQQLREASHARELQALNEKLRDAVDRCEQAECDAARLQDQLTKAEKQFKEANQALVDTLAANNFYNRAASDDSRLLEEITELRQSLASVEAELENARGDRYMAQQQLENSEAALRRLSEQLEEKECRLTAQFNNEERLKEEILELQQEIELQKLSERDPKMKGNSAFAEVEDHRLYLEHQLRKLQKQYNTISLQYQSRTHQVNRLKVQVASLLSAGQKESEYEIHLNKSLDMARSQISVLRDQCRDLQRRLDEQTDRPLVINCLPGGCVSRSSYYVNAFTATQKELNSVRRSLEEARFQSTLVSDQFLQLQRKLHFTERSVLDQKAECVRLSVQLSELQVNNSTTSENISLQARKVEKLPGHPDLEQEKCSDKNKEIQEDANEENNSATVGIICADTIGNPRSVDSISRNSVSVSDLKVLPAGPENSTVMAETVDDDSEANKENILSCNAGEETVVKDLVAGGDKKKKSVRLQSVVQVHDTEGKINSAAVKKHDGSSERPKRLRRILKAPPVQHNNEEQCRQQ